MRREFRQGLSAITTSSSGAHRRAERGPARLGYPGLDGFVHGIRGAPYRQVLGTLPVPLYLALALWIDRYERELTWMLVGTFIYGGLQ